MILSDVPAGVAGVFTKNRVKGAPLVVTMAQMKRSRYCRAIVVNSGNANACTGDRGIEDAVEMTRASAAALGVAESEVLVASTGVIGRPLPMERITEGINRLADRLGRNGGSDAAEAIMTTDTFPKELTVPFRSGNVRGTIGAMAKGSGMIHPNMATMLAFVTTDLTIGPDALQKALNYANSRSFNRISVDGDMSTNDMVLVTANGMAGSPELAEGTAAYDDFCITLESVLVDLARRIVSDGEGATRLVEVTVRGARTEDEALQAARAVAGSNLVKTAVHGADPNWGRILAAVGYSGIECRPELISILLNEHPVLLPGYRIVLDEDRGRAALSGRNVVITVDLGEGTESATVWTCDLSGEYVRINASYRT